jgi:Tfp pilus assembly protein PilZ
MEKRCENRIIKRLEVKFQTEVENTAITSDLSESGLFIRTNRGISPGTVINLKLNLPNAQELALIGKVIRSMKSMPGLIGESKSGMGIHLINPPESYISYVQSIRTNYSNQTV